MTSSFLCLKLKGGTELDVKIYSGYSGSKVHTFLKFRAPLSGEAVHAFPEVSAVN